MIRWEVHKSVIRGELIKIGAQHKREREKPKYQNLLNKIANLESVHRETLS